MQDAGTSPAVGQMDGIHGMVPRERMSPSARKLRDAYARKPDAPFFQREFGFYCLDRWKEQGMPQGVPLEKLFGYDPPGAHVLGELGWCEAAFSPAFEEKLLEDRGEHELAQDRAGRHVLFFKGRRSGFTPLRPVNMRAIQIRQRALTSAHGGDSMCAFGQIWA